MKIFALLAGLILLPVISFAQPATVPRAGSGSGSGSGTATNLSGNALMQVTNIARTFGSTNWLTDANGNGYGVNFFALKDRNGVAIMQLWSPTSTNGGNASMEVYGGGTGAPFKVSGDEWITAKLGIGVQPSGAGANLEVAGTVGGTANALAHIGTNSSSGFFVSSNGQNVGIGTNAATATLEINQASAGTNLALKINDTNGQTRVRLGVWPSSTSYGALYLGNTATVPGVANYALISDGTTLLVNGPSSGVQFRVGNSDMGFWNATGLGVGTLTPTERLSVQGNATIATNLTVTNLITAANGDFSGGINTRAGSLGYFGLTSFALNSATIMSWNSDASIGRFGNNTNYFGTATTATNANGTAVASNYVGRAVVLHNSTNAITTLTAAQLANNNGQLVVSNGTLHFFWSDGATITSAKVAGP